MSEHPGRERDLVLAPNEFIHVLDETKGNINTYVGPNKASLGNTEKPVVFNDRTKRFQVCPLDEAIQHFRVAPEGWYIILKNPARNGEQPEAGKMESLSDLNVGRKVNIPGPISFPTWPGQMSKVVKGHHLRYNQYLIGRVYDDEAARSNWEKAVVKKQSEGEGEGEEGEDTGAKAEMVLGVNASQLTMGQLIVIKGTDVSFFIPPTGIEILADDEGKYARRAVTLERLEYCILLDEDGNKRFVKGPDVVFPKPTESFLRRRNEEGKVTRKFRAIELNPQMGIYIKVIAPYQEDGKMLEAGTELFLRGDEVRIYYPRPEHAIMRYGEGQEIHYAVAIPAGEGRYLLHKDSGVITTERGPSMLLPDPRSYVIVNRVLSPSVCQLMYPGNQEALQHNMGLTQMVEGGDDVERMHRESQYSSRHFLASNAVGLQDETKTSGGIVLGQEYPEGTLESGSKPRRSRRKGLQADDFSRKTTYTPPRSITLNTKYQGAVMVSVWTGYAVQVCSKSGERRVEVGPKTILLEYDESLDVIKLSRGRPKGSSGQKEDVYLRVRNNKMGDIVEAETSDLVEVTIELSYRMNFEGDDSSLWFEVEDYPKFVSDHLRSMIRNAIKKVGVEEFSKNPTDLIRDTVLGEVADGKRKGRVFEENGLRVYDVEVLNVTVGDKSISDLLRKTQNDVVRQTLDLANRERRLTTDRRIEEIQREIDAERNKTCISQLDLAAIEGAKQAELEMARVAGQIEEKALGIRGELESQEMLDGISEAELARNRAQREQELDLARVQLQQVMDDLKARSDAWVAKANAIQPELVAALQSNSDVQLLSQAFQNMAPLSILGNKTVADLVKGLVQGTKLEGIISPKQIKED